MRRATAWFVVVGVAVFATVSPVRADDGFWVSIASGVAGAAAPTDYREWWFETPHGPPPVAVTQLDGTSVQATTAGGSSFFNAGAVPVVVHPTDGYAYLAGGTPPSDLTQALRRQMAGGKGLASTTPDANATAPPAGANLLSISQGAPAANGSSSLTVSMTDANANPLGGGSINIPSNGWWVIGLGPNPQDATAQPPDSTPVIVPSPPPDTTPTTPPTTPPTGPVATPEPATLLLAGLGGLSAFGWQFTRRRRPE